MNSKLANHQHFIITIPESYKLCIEEIREIYHSNLKRDSRIKFINVILSNLEDLARLVQEKLASFNKISNRLLEELKQEKITIRQNDPLDFSEIKNAVYKMEETKYLEEIINLFPTTSLKSSFLHGYVSKHTNELNISPNEYNYLALKIEEKDISDEEEGNEDSEGKIDEFLKNYKPLNPYKVPIVHIPINGKINF